MISQYRFMLSITLESSLEAAFGTMVENCSSGLLGWFAVRGNPSSLFRLVSKIIK